MAESKKPEPKKTEEKKFNYFEKIMSRTDGKRPEKLSELLGLFSGDCLVLSLELLNTKGLTVKYSWDDSESAIIEFGKPWQTKDEEKKKLKEDAKKAAKSAAEDHGPKISTKD